MIEGAETGRPDQPPQTPGRGTAAPGCPPVLTFRVPGLPRPGGSKRSVPHPGRPGKHLVIDDNPDVRIWKKSVTLMAKGAMRGRPPMGGPLKATFIYYLPSPKDRYRSNGELRAHARSLPTVRPDVLKLTRPTEDALTGVVYFDDAQIVEEHLYKVYADHSDAAWVGAVIRLEVLP